MACNLNRDASYDPGPVSAGSAGVAIACYTKHREAGKVEGKTCIVICCGGNVSEQTLHRARTLAQELPSL